jgi:LysM repeat protein
MSRPRRRHHAGVARYAAPAAFLLAVTIAVLLVRAGLRGSDTTTTTSQGPVTTAPAKGTKTRTKPNVRTTPTSARFYTVQTGDTFGSIAAKTGISIARLQELNPDVSSNSLQVGQRLRVK